MRRKHLVPLLGIVLSAFGLLAIMLATNRKPELGLDLQGGASVVLKAKGTPSADAMSKAKEIIRNRVDSLGVSEPEVSQQGNTIVVSLPGVKDQEAALNAVGATAELRFRPVLLAIGADESQSAPDLSVINQQAQVQEAFNATEVAATSTSVVDVGASTSTTAAGGPSRQPRQADPTTTTVTPTTTVAAPVTTVADPSVTTASPPIPTTIYKTSTRDEDLIEATVVLPQTIDKTVVRRYILGPAILTGKGVKTAEPQFANTGEWSVALELKSGAAGTELWNQLAAACFNTTPQCPTKQLAIVLDGNVISAPEVNEPSFADGKVSISGSFDQESARQLASVLNFGSLPVELEPQAVQTVSATLGKDSLRAGLISGVVGIGLVLLFMLFYYRMLAIVVVAGLLVSSALMYAIISWRGAVMTLAGAAGIIVSIGVTVDSYVVFFERLKDEVRSGRTLRASTTKGFAGAWRTILAADSVSLIAAGLLYWRTVGSVRGFAFYLGLSTLIDLFVAWFFTRNAVALMARSRWFSGKRVLGVATPNVPLAGAVS